MKEARDVELMIVVAPVKLDAYQEAYHDVYTFQQLCAWLTYSELKSLDHAILACGTETVQGGPEAGSGPTADVDIAGAGVEDPENSRPRPWRM